MAAFLRVSGSINVFIAQTKDVEAAVILCRTLQAYDHSNDYINVQVLDLGVSRLPIPNK